MWYKVTEMDQRVGEWLDLPDYVPDRFRELDVVIDKGVGGIRLGSGMLKGWDQQGMESLFRVVEIFREPISDIDRSFRGEWCYVARFSNTHWARKFRQWLKDMDIPESPMVAKIKQIRTYLDSTEIQPVRRVIREPNPQALDFYQALKDVQEKEQARDEAKARTPSYTGHLDDIDFYGEEEEALNRAIDRLWETVKMGLR